MSNGNDKQGGTALVEAPKSSVPQAAVGERGLEIKSLDALWWLSNRIVRSGLAPKDCTTPEDALIRMQMGYELGLSPMQSVQQIANINGRPSVWGPAVKGLIMSRGICEGWEEKYEGKDDGKFADDFAAVIIAKRKGHAPLPMRFSVADAKRAGLWGKSGPWTQYPKDQLMSRATGRIAKRLFPDVLCGLDVAEEARDYIETTAEVVDPKTGEILNAKPSLDTLADAVGAMADTAPTPEPDDAREKLLREIDSTIAVKKIPLDTIDAEVANFDGATSISDLDNIQLQLLCEFCRAWKAKPRKVEP